MDLYYIVLIGLVFFIIGFVFAYWMKGKMVFEKIKSAEEEALRILNDAKRKSETFLKEAKIESKGIHYKMKAEFDAETKETQSELKKRENRLIQKEENIDRKIEQFEPRERDLVRKERTLTKREENIEQSKLKYNELIEEQKFQLEKISGLTVAQAKELLIRD